MSRSSHRNSELLRALQMLGPSSPTVSCKTPLTLPVVTVLAAVVFPPSTAIPQDQSNLMQTWQLFLDHCGRAYVDQQRFVDDISVAQHWGILNVGGTPDDKISWLTITGTVMSIEYSDTVVGDRRMYGCSAMAILDGDPTKSEVMHTTFLEDIASQPELAVSGGSIPETSLGMGGYAGIGLGSYRYAVLGALPQQIVAEIVFSPWSIEVLSVHIDGPS